MKSVAILQSNYIPWKGYFDLINQVDEFIILDEVQFTKNDWRNRNKIKTQSNVEWLSIPVRHYSMDQLIRETRVADQRWAKKHWQTIVTNYAKAPHFKTLAPKIEKLYSEAAAMECLSEINYLFIEFVLRFLECKTLITNSTDYRLEGGRVERLVNLCLQAHATSYLSGPSAKNYLNEGAFNAAGISVKWMDYGGYREYPQLFPPFEHSVTILDMLLNVGPEVHSFMKSF